MKEQSRYSTNNTVDKVVYVLEKGLNERTKALYHKHYSRYNFVRIGKGVERKKRKSLYHKHYSRYNFVRIGKGVERKKKVAIAQTLNPVQFCMYIFSS